MALGKEVKTFHFSIFSLLKKKTLMTLGILGWVLELHVEKLDDHSYNLVDHGLATDLNAACCQKSP